MLFRDSAETCTTHVGARLICLFLECAALSSYIRAHSAFMSCIFSWFNLALSVSGLDKLSQCLTVIVRLFLLAPQAVHILLSNTLHKLCTEVMTEREMI